MPKGGHARSGPPPDPNSARSDARGVKFTALPAEGYSGAAPDFPLPKASARELELWAWLWTTPQACAWALPSERWRLHSIAMYVRTFVVCESLEATAADKGSLHRFADDIGMTPAGLRQNGWAVAMDVLGEKRAEPKTPKKSSARGRMKVVNGDGA